MRHRPFLIELLLIFLNTKIHGIDFLLLNSAHTWPTRLHAKAESYIMPGTCQNDNTNIGGLDSDDHYIYTPIYTF